MDQCDYLDKLHGILLEILDYVAAICDKHGITYVLCEGTALGAYRHKGFIPWDDDLDIAVPRSDYDKLLRLVRDDKSSCFVVQDELSDPDYFQPFAKIRKRGTKFIESYAEGLYKENGIWIDVFPMDHVDNASGLIFRLKYVGIKYLSHISKFKNCKSLYKEKWGRVKYLLDCVISSPALVMSNQTLLSTIRRICSGSISQTETDKLIVWDDWIWVIESEMILPPKTLEFERRAFPAPSKIEDYLKVCYGDEYMCLPPEENRRTHMPSEVEF